MKRYLLVILCVFLCIGGCGKSSSKKQETESVNKHSKHKKDTSENSDKEDEVLEKKLPEHTALDDGNLFGNTLCYARMLKVEDKLYFRNPFDNERLYSMGKGEVPKPAFGEVYPKDMHYKDGYIYYANTGIGDTHVKGIDRNIYRINIEDSQIERLSNVEFDDSENDVWLSFDTMVGDDCYYGYYDGKKQGYCIAKVNINTKQNTIIYLIPMENCSRSPMINVVDNKIYYIAKNGLNTYNMDTGENTLVIENFTCSSYMIYDNKVYYSKGIREEETNASIKVRSLSDGNAEDIYVAQETTDVINDIQFNIYNENIYFVTKSSDVERAKDVSKLYIYKMSDSSKELAELSPRANWFNIFNGKIYYKYSDSNDIELSRSEPIYKISINSDLDVDKLPKARVFEPEEFNKGWKTVNNSWYYYEAGKLTKNSWKELDGSWYYFDSDGKMLQNNWGDINGSWYYFDTNGIMVRNNWILVGDLWYYFNPDGSMIKGSWSEINGSWYYFNTDGSMVRNAWLNFADRNYYMGDDGKMYVNATTPDGRKVGADGVEVKFRAEYLDILNKYSYGLTKDEAYGTGQYIFKDIYVYGGNSIVIDKGNYYEITDCTITRVAHFPLNMVENKKVGDWINILGENYQIEEVNDSYVCMSEMYNIAKYSDYCELIYAGTGVSYEEEIYKGSLYVAKNAPIIEHLSGGYRTINFKDYVDSRDIYMGQWSCFNIDKQGIVTTYFINFKTYCLGGE